MWISPWLTVIASSIFGPYSHSLTSLAAVSFFSRKVSGFSRIVCFLFNGLIVFAGLRNPVRGLIRYQVLRMAHSTLKPVFHGLETRYLSVSMEKCPI